MLYHNMICVGIAFKWLDVLTWCVYQMNSQLINDKWHKMNLIAIYKLWTGRCASATASIEASSARWCASCVCVNNFRSGGKVDSRKLSWAADYDDASHWGMIYLWEKAAFEDVAIDIIYIYAFAPIANASRFNLSRTHNYAANTVMCSTCISRRGLTHRWRGGAWQNLHSTHSAPPCNVKLTFIRY